MTEAERPPTIVSMGRINVGLIGVASRLPMPGETLRGEEFYTAPGGKGATQAVAAARMGARVRMVGRVGGDVFGPMLVEAIRGHGIDVSRVATDVEQSSGVGMILLDAQRQNHVVAIYGANLRCDQEQVDAAVAALDGADSLLLQMEIPFEVSRAVARVAKERGVRVVLDPAPAAEIQSETYQDLDIVTPNQTEAEFHAGVQVTDAASAREAADVLLGRGVGVVVMKLAEQGVYFASATERGYVPPFEVEVVDTISAGDAFSGALAVALGEGRGVEEAVRFGAAAGALAVTRRGVQTAMPERAEVDELVRRG